MGKQKKGERTTELHRRLSRRALDRWSFDPSNERELLFSASSTSSLNNDPPTFTGVVK